MQKWAFNISCIAIGIFIIGSVFISIAYAEEKAVPETVLQIKSNYFMPEMKLSPRIGDLRSEKAAQWEKVEMEMYLPFSYSKDWEDEDIYLLAKIAMAEAENSSEQCKTLTIMVVLNRVESSRFPDSIREVIFQYDDEKGTYQFSCIGDGRWDKVEPNQDCFDAVEIVLDAEYDYSGGALYFENCMEEDNWHSQNLDFLYQCDALRFYR